MSKEVENLIMENNELLATKNALNIANDELIARVDELTGEIEILREELNAMQQSRNELRTKVQELEEELKKTKEQVKQQNENDVSLHHQKHFSRMEMAMVLMERDQYKERLMQLQEALRLTEILRATRTGDNSDKKSNQSIFKYFGSLVTPPINGDGGPTHSASARLANDLANKDCVEKGTSERARDFTLTEFLKNKTQDLEEN